MAYAFYAVYLIQVKTEKSSTDFQKHHLWTMFDFGPTMVSGSSSILSRKKTKHFLS